MSLLLAASIKEREALLRKIIVPFKEMGEQHDRQQTIPFENIQTLREYGYPALPVEKQFGGQEISLSELLSLQELIAREDGPTALSIGWHMGTMYQMALEKNWTSKQRELLSVEVVKNSAIVNVAATEKATGSPTRGGAFTTKARKTANGWILDGEKTFYTLVEALDYYLILATLSGSEQNGLFLVPKGTEGTEIEKTWDMSAMGSTGSHTFHLRRVEVPDDALVRIQDKSGLPTAWLLHIPACYLGIGYAALMEAVAFARAYAPNSVGTEIAQLPTVRQKLGEAKVLYEQSRELLHGVANRWDAANEDVRRTMTLPLMVAKHSVVDSANKIVDLSMRVVGAHSLANHSALSRYYRNVRAGLHNPPMEDRTIETAVAHLLDK